MNSYYEDEWHADFIMDFYIYQIWSGKDLKNPYFYGDYNGMSLISSFEKANLYEIMPTERCEWNDGILYFIGYNQFERLCIYLEDIKSVQWFDYQIDGRYFFKVSWIKPDPVIYINFITYYESILCQITIDSQKCLDFSRLNVISIISLEKSFYLISASTFISKELNYYLVHHDDNLAFKYQLIPNTTAKSKWLKSGGIYNFNNKIIYKIEQFDLIYLIQFYSDPNLIVSYSFQFKQEFNQWVFSGFIDFSYSIVYALLNWRYYTIIVIEKDQEKPIAFKSREDFEYRAAVIDDNFILYFQKSEFLFMLSFTTIILNIISIWD